MTLLEVMVALVILGLVLGAYLELIHAGHALVARSGDWAEAVAYAADGLERAKADSTGDIARVEVLPHGFRRRTVTRPWGPGLARVTVSVALPNGRQLELETLRPSATRPASGAAR